MVWALLYLLGVPLWMIAGALLGRSGAGGSSSSSGSLPVQGPVATDPAAPAKWPAPLAGARGSTTC
jgi:hypothetical protein